MSFTERLKYDWTDVFVLNSCATSCVTLYMMGNQWSTDYHNKLWSLFHLFFTRLVFQDGCFRAHVFKDFTVSYISKESCLDCQWYKRSKNMFYNRMTRMLKYYERDSLNSKSINITQLLSIRCGTKKWCKSKASAQC